MSEEKNNIASQTNMPLIDQNGKENYIEPMVIIGKSSRNNSGLGSRVRTLNNGSGAYAQIESGSESNKLIEMTNKQVLNENFSRESLETKKIDLFKKNLKILNLQKWKEQAQNSINQKQNVKMQMKIDENYRDLIKKRIETTKNIKKKKTSQIDDLLDQTLLDDNAQQEEDYKTPIISAGENINKFVKNYGINFEIPSSHIQKCRFYPKKPEYCLQLVNYIIPNSQEPSSENQKNPLIDGTLKMQTLIQKSDKKDENEEQQDDENQNEDGQDEERQDEERQDEEEVEKLNENHQEHDHKTMVKSHYINGDSKTVTISEQYQELQKGIYLKLLKKQEGKGIQNVEEIILGLENDDVACRYAEMRFSHDSQYLAIFLQNLNYLKIIKIEDGDIEKTFKQIAKGEKRFLSETKNVQSISERKKILKQIYQENQKNYYWVYPDQQQKDTYDQNKDNKQHQEYNLSWVKSLYFDQQNKYIVLCGGLKIQILNLEDRQLELKTKISNIDYIEILDVQLDSNNIWNEKEKKEKYKCQVACRQKDKGMIDIFDIDYDVNFFKNNEKQSGHIRQIQYLELNKDTKVFVKISSDFKKAILVCGKEENYLLENEEENGPKLKKINTKNFKNYTSYKTSLRKINQLNGRQVRFIKDDDQGNFYIVAFEEYDSYMDILYTEGPNNPLKFYREIEPGLITCQDIDVQKQILDRRDICNIRLATVKDAGDSFYLDQATFDYIKNDENGKPYNYIKVKPQESNRKATFDDIECQLDVIAPSQGFSFKWPYLAMSFRPNWVIILNAFDNTTIHRVQLPDNTQLICQTYISDTNDLYILANYDKYYRLFRIDLDEGNLKEQTGVVDFSYKVQNIFQYSSEFVNKKPLLDLHVRGASDKEHVNNNEKLIACILHQDVFYYWIQNKDNKTKVKDNHIKLNNLRDKRLELKQNEEKNLSEIKQIENEIETIYKDFDEINQNSKNLYTNQTSSQLFYAIHDECFFLMEEEYLDESSQEIEAQVIYKYIIDFGQIKKSETIRSKYSEEQIINFNVDVQELKLLILSKIQNLDDDRNSKFTIYDINNKLVENESILQWKRLIGRLKSGLYKAAGGHLYFGNNIIKIRYDLIKNSNGQDFRDTDVYDYFEDIFFLEKSEKIMAACPEICYTFNKFVYIVKNIQKRNSQQKASHIYIFPFLHDQKIYLHRQKPNTEYFYTQIENRSMIDYVNKTEPLKIQAKQFWKMQNIKNMFQNEKKQEEKKPQHNYRQIVCMNLTESKYYIYSKRGLLINRIDYSKEVSQYGRIVATSANGLNFILAHRQNSKNKKNEIAIFHLSELSFFFVKKLIIEDEVDDYINALLKNDDTKLQGMKLQLLIKNPNAPNNWIYNNQLKKISYTINDQMDVLINFKNLQKFKKVEIQEEEQQFQFSQRLKRNCCKQISSFNNKSNKVVNKMVGGAKDIFNQKTQEDQLTEEKNKLLTYKHIFLFQAGIVGLQRVPDEQLHLLNLQKIEKNEMIQKNFILLVDRDKKNIMISSKEADEDISLYDLKNQDIETLQEDLKELDEQGDPIQKAVPQSFTMNKEYAVMWDDERIQAYQISIKEDIQYQQIPVSFKISSSLEDVRSKIIDIRLGTKSDLMAIILSFGDENDCIIFWSLKKNAEKSTIDVSKNYELLWDPQGNPYIVDCKNVYFVKEVCQMMCFEEQDINYIRSINKTYEFISTNKGNRVDGDNHNFMILQNYLSLGFSFMHFLIKFKIEKKRSIQIGGTFDPIPFNYLFNKSTAFLDSKFVRFDHEILQRVCDALSQIDTGLLNQLHYTKMDKFMNVDEKIFSFSYSINFQFNDKQKNIEGDSKEKIPIKESSLHIAYNSGNNRAVDIILKYLAINPSFQYSFYQDIMSNLVVQKEFITYISSISYQNEIIRDKQILKLDYIYKPNMIAINDSKQTYLDSVYFKEVMHEGQDVSLLRKIQNFFTQSNNFESTSLRSFPVSIQALELAWIIEDKDQNGLNFLYAIQNSGNINLYSNKSVIAIIEYLYKKFLPYILWRTLPFNLAQIVIFFAMIYVNELSYPIMSIDEYNAIVADLTATNTTSTQSLVTPNQNYQVIQIILAAVNLCLTAQLMYQIAREFYELTQGDNIMQFFTEMFNWIYFMFIGLNSALSIMIIIDYKVEYQRRISAFLVLFVFMRFLYYLKLVEGLNKHIDIFFYILEGITSVLVLILLMFVAFSNSFYLLGLNQIQFDLSPQCTPSSPADCSNPSFPAFNTYTYSLFYTFNMFVGNADTSAFTNGQNDILSVIFCIASFFLMIIIFNMLVAVMGDIFETSGDVYDQLKLKEQLQFVLDNWRYKERIVNPNNAKFIIAAFNVDSSDDQLPVNDLYDNLINTEKNQLE